MNCNYVRSLLDISAAEVPEPLKSELDAHIDACPACQRAFETLRRVDAVLRAWPAPPPPPEYPQRVLRRMFEDAVRRRRRTVAALGFAAVLAVGVLIGSLLGVRAGQRPDYTLQDGALVLQGGRPTTVGVSFEAASSLQSVRFTIDLPSGMQLTDRPGMRHLSWMGELRKGRNLLRLPVVAQAGTDGVLVAVLSSGVGSRTFRLHVLAEDPASSGAIIVRRIGAVLGWQS